MRKVSGLWFTYFTGGSDHGAKFCRMKCRMKGSGRRRFEIGLLKFSMPNLGPLGSFLAFGVFRVFRVCRALGY